MAFAVRNLSVLAYAQGFTLWHYKSAADPLAETVRTGFFDPAADLLNGGDMMLISAPDGGRASVVQAASGTLSMIPMA